jgi:hypothetical protein
VTANPVCAPGAGRLYEPIQLLARERTSRYKGLAVAGPRRDGVPVTARDVARQVDGGVLEIDNELLATEASEDINIS